MYSQKTSVINDSKIARLLDKLGLFLNIKHPLVIDSRKVVPHAIFCAYPGTNLDGRDFIKVAIDAGAEVILWEPGISFNYPLTNFAIENLIQYVGILAAYKEGYPSNDMLTFAVTGTNGKTSISHWLNQAYNLLGVTAGIIGTTGAGIYPYIDDYAMTTPDPITLHSLIAKFKDEAVNVLVMEVSSHALEQGRVNGMQFTTAIFTNLTQDHLDYHKTMDNYFAAKEKLFYWQGLRHAVINSDDKYGQKLIKTLQQDNSMVNKVISYGINSGDVTASNIELNLSGIKFLLNYEGKEQLITAPLIGRFNLYNLLGVLAALVINGVAWASLAAITKRLKPVTGRMDAIILPDKPLVVVDFSHTPDALANALSTLREISGDSKLICVFGCGGNRDRKKRPQMGQIAINNADWVIVTSDNPRFEDPDLIIDEIVINLPNDNYQRITDRREAVSTAIKLAKAGDVVLIAGKGHETYQEIQGVKHHFSDLEIVKELLNA